jgi:GTPase SAR1 family protein
LHRTSNEYRGASGVVILYDVRQADSAKIVQDYLTQTDELADDWSVMLVVGHVLDDDDDTSVDDAEKKPSVVDSDDPDAASYRTSSSDDDDDHDGGGGGGGGGDDDDDDDSDSDAFRRSSSSGLGGGSEQDDDDDDGEEDALLTNAQVLEQHAAIKAIAAKARLRTVFLDAVSSRQDCADAFAMLVEHIRIAEADKQSNDALSPSSALGDTHAASPLSGVEEKPTPSPSEPDSAAANATNPTDDSTQQCTMQ